MCSERPFYWTVRCRGLFQYSERERGDYLREECVAAQRQSRPEHCAYQHIAKKMHS